MRPVPRRPDDPTVSGSRTISNTRLSPLPRWRSVLVDLLPSHGPGAILSLTGAKLTLAGTRLGHGPLFVRCFKAADHSPRQSADRSPVALHVPSPFEPNHRSKEFRFVRTAFRESRNVFRS